jgi:hypothetical protein
MLVGDKSDMPGMIRASFGLYNTTEDVDKLVEALDRVARGEYAGIYHQDTASGEFTPQGWNPDFNRYFAL